VATPLEWSLAYRVQAEEDFKAAAATRRTPSVYVMLLQMAFEKLAKAAYCKQRNEVPSFKHDIGPLVWQFMARRQVTGFHERTVDKMVSLLFAIENANPAVVNKLWKLHGDPHAPQLEYPWEEITGGAVKTPVHDLPLAKTINDPTNPQGPMLEKFAQTLLKRFDAVFP
jgi:hypothetical protein